MKPYILIIALLFSATMVKAASFYSIASGNWNSASTWSSTSGGLAGTTTPTSADNVIIERGFSVTIPAGITANAKGVDINAPTTGLGGTSVLIMSDNSILNITSSDFNIKPGTLATYVAKLLMGSATLNITSGGGNDLTFNAASAVTATNAIIDMRAGSGTINLGRNFNNPTYGTVYAGGGTFDYATNTGSAQTIANITYNNLTLSGTGIKKLAGATIVNGTFSIQGTATFSLNSNILTYGSSSTLDYSGSAAQTTGAELSALLSPANITINNASDVTLNVNNVSISGNLTLTSGNFILGSNTFIVNNSATTAISGSGHVRSETTASPYGVLQWNIGSVTGTRVFPFANASGVAVPVTIVNTGNVGNVGIATYPTAANNTPFPSGVANVNTSTGANNSANLVDRFWVISSSAGSGPSTVTFAYADAEAPANGELGTDNKGLYAQPYRSGWNFQTSTQTNNAAANSVTVSSVTTLSADWALSLHSSPLPVTLVSFLARLESNSVCLEWSTASEHNNKAFYVERSVNGTDFEDLGAVAGAGSSSSIHNYTYNDNAKPEGIVYYRLRQEDFDGTVSYSPLRKVSPNAETAVRIYPNPLQAGQTLNISTSGQFAMAEWVNMEGKTVSSSSAEAGSLSTAGLAAGVYELKLSDTAGNMSFQRVLVTP